MATQVLQSLIDKQDNFEVVRDQIVTILKEEVVNQMALATTGGKDPNLWNLRVFKERSNPWDIFLKTSISDSRIPIVNVWFDNESPDPGKVTNIMESTKVNGTFNVDCYGCGLAADDGGSGHTPGDLDAASEVQRALRLVRNILMASHNSYLQLRNTIVWGRVTESITAFQPEISDQSAKQVQAIRLSLGVDFVEFSPQYEAVTLEETTVTVERVEDGEVVADQKFVST